MRGRAGQVRGRVLGGVGGGGGGGGGGGLSPPPPLPAASLTLSYPMSPTCPPQHPPTHTHTHTRRAVGRLDEALAPYLPPAKRAYVFGGLPAAAARLAVWALPDIRRINHEGVQRMCRMLSSLQVGGVGAGLEGSGGVPALLFRPSTPLACERCGPAPPHPPTHPPTITHTHPPTPPRPHPPPPTRLCSPRCPAWEAGACSAPTPRGRSRRPSEAGGKGGGACRGGRLRVPAARSHLPRPV